MASTDSPRSLRRAYLDWVEAQVEAFKDDIPRSDLLRIADGVVEELRMTKGGQYQLTELLLCNAMDRHIFRMLKLPGYRAWCDLRRRAEESLIPASLTIPEPPPAKVHALRVAPATAAAAEREEERAVACVV